MNSPSTHQYDTIKIILTLIIIALIIFFIANEFGKRSGFNQAQVFDSPIAFNTTIGDTLPQTLPGADADGGLFTDLDTSSSDMSQMLKDGGITVLRSLGGTSADYAHFLDTTGKPATGFGILQSEIKKFGASPDKDKEASWTTDYNYSFFSSLLTMAHNAGAKVILSLNVDTQIAPGHGQFDRESIDLSTNEALASINQAISQGVNVYAVQLGAEQYLTGDTMLKLYPTANDYVNRVGPIASAIKAEHPDIKVVLHPAPYDRTTSRAKDWTSAILGNSSLYSTIDGVNIYQWLRPEDVGCSKGTVDEQFACMNTASKAFVASEVATQLNGTQSQFPGKDIYVGEWGMSGYNYGGAVPVTTFDNSMLDVLHGVDYLLSLGVYDANNHNIVKNSSFMTLGGEGKDTANLISGIVKDGSDTGNITSEGGFVKRAFWHAYEMVNKIYDGSHRLLAGSFTFPSVPGDNVRGYSFRGSGGDLIFIITNRSGASIPLESALYDGEAFTGVGDITVESVYGSALSSTYGDKKYTGTSSQITHTPPIAYTATSDVVINPYSVTRIFIPAIGDSTPPAVPTNLRSGSDGAGLVLEWDPATDNHPGTLTYTIYQDGGSAPIGSTTATSYSLANAAAGTHNYSVTAVDIAGNASSESAVFAVTKSEIVPPTEPVKLTISDVTETSAVLSWTAATDASGDLLVYSILVPNQNDPIATTTDTTYALTNLTPGTVYRYGIQAKDSSGNVSSRSNALRFRTLKSRTSQVPQTSEEVAPVPEVPLE